MDVNNPQRLGPGEPWRDRYAHACAWDEHFPPLSLVELFGASVAAHPLRPLVEFEGRDFTYAELFAEARRFAAGLQARGVARGDRVGLFLPNVPTYIPAYYGTLMAGATVVNFSPLYTAEELEAQVVDSGTRILVTLDVPALLPTALEVLRDSPLDQLVVARLADLLPPLKKFAVKLFGRGKLTPVPRQGDVCAWSACLGTVPMAIPVDPERDLALLQYTGGTTGTPKGAMLTHQNLTANARQIRAIDPDKGKRDMVLGVLPLFHVFANTCVLNRTVLNGGCISMLPRFDGTQTLKRLGQVRPTALFAVPTMLQALLDHPDLPNTDFSSIREVISGGAPLPQPVKARFEAATGTRVIEGYGLTEGSGVITTNPLKGENRPGTIGQPLPATRLRLLDKEDPSQDAPEGEPGELAILGPQVMQGYWNRPDAEAAAFAVRGTERWLRTGDIATFDPDGYVRIVDRSKDMIAVGGFKVFPSQVEAVLLQHPAVSECLVIGMADEYRGEVPRAYVTLRHEAEASGAELKDWLNAKIGKHERVDEVVVRASLPKTAIGKLDRKALRAEVAR
ncbi:MAG: AMP-binding protein [Novosphingobium sp.]